MTVDMGAFVDDSSSIYSELQQVLVKKQQDYGPHNISAAPGGAVNGLLVRMNDKMERLKNLYYSDREVQNESLEDSFLDLANYAVICLMVQRGKWPA